MRNDPARRFAFGLTIENTETRVWFASRSGVMVTEPFNFMKVRSFFAGCVSSSPVKQDRKTFIRVISSLTFATPQQHGYDLTVKHTKAPDGSTQHEIMVGAKTFVTEGLPLANYGADALTGRGTRVFRAYDIHNPTKRYALKDVWIDADRDTEGSVLERLLEGASVEEKKHFLTVAYHGYVQVRKHDGQTLVDDHTHLVMMREQELPLETRSLASIGLPNANSSHDFPSIPTSIPPLPRQPPRKHYRIVFEEIGTALHDLDNLTDVFDALCQVVAGMICRH